MKVAEKYETVLLPCSSHTFWEAEVSPVHKFTGESIDHFLWMIGFSLLTLLWLRNLATHLCDWALTPHSFTENTSLNHSWLIFCQIIDMDLCIANSSEPIIYIFRTEYLNFDKLKNYPRASLVHNKLSYSLYDWSLNACSHENYD